ncbi:MAG: hypothetical protein Q7L07_17035 [Pseudohongiella sp.]|nr:hypothetical protein [Pseudohongiella sp.]
MTTIASKEEHSLERLFYASKEAGTFNIYSRRWILSHTDLKGLAIPDFKKWPPAQKEALLRTLAERATKYQHTSIRSDISTLKSFAKLFSKSDEFFDSGIDVRNLLEWFASKTNDETKTNIRRLVLSAIEYGYGEAFEDGVLSLVKQYRGKRIRLHPDRFEGSRSFTESERMQLLYQLVRESHLGHIPQNIRVASTLVLITGKRPIQIAQSKFIDFSRETMSLGHGDCREFVIYNAPVAKKAGQRFRSQFNSTPIASDFEIWDDLVKLREDYVGIIKQSLNIDITEELSYFLPIFMPSNISLIGQRFTKGEKERLPIEDFLHSDRLHQTGASLAGTIRRLGKYITILSDYTGAPLSINAKRFRHTRATNLALSGASIEEIADSLDHSDNRTAAEYVDNLPVRAIKIGRQVEDTLGALANIFSGASIEDSEQVIKLYTKNGTHNVGHCGREAFCSENYPIACYECELFQPNPFGNHAAVQEYVESQIQAAKEIGDNRLIENWYTIMLAVLERRYVADQQRLQMLNEIPKTVAITKEDYTSE